MFLDIGIIVFIIVMGLIYYNKGLIYSICLAVSNILAIVISVVLANVYSSRLNEIIGPFISPYIEDYILQTIDIHEAIDLVQKGAEAPFISELFSTLSKTSLEQIINMEFNEAFSAILKSMINSLSQGISYLLVLIGAFIVLKLIFALIIAIFKFMFEDTILTKFDKIIGGVVGLGIGLVLVAGTLWIGFTMVPTFKVLLDTTLSDAYITKYIINITPEFYSNIVS